MLALSRKQNQAIVLDNGVRIQVVRLAGNRVTIGILAPSDVTILREELLCQSVGAYQSDLNVPCLASSNA